MATEAEHHELADSPFRVGDWLVEPRLNRVTCGDESIQIELKMMDVLVCLAERAGKLVTRREITDTVWATEFITEKTLTRAVAELRRTLGDDAKPHAGKLVAAMKNDASPVVRLATAELPQTRSEAAIPLRSRGQVLGALTVQDTQPGAFDRDTIAVLQTMADQVAVALDNARHVERLESEKGRLLREKG